MFLRITLLGIAVLAFTACNLHSDDQADQAVGNSGLELTLMDTSVRPQDDFYRYVNGVWLDTTEIPEDKSTYGSFTILRDESLKNLRTIIDEVTAMENTQAGTPQQQVGDLYKSFMNTAHIETLGVEPLREKLDAISAVTNHGELQTLMNELTADGIGIPYRFSVAPDDRNSSAYMLSISQSGLGLPDRSYYFREEEKYQTIRKAYVNYLATIFKLAGLERSQEQAQTLLDLETLLAEQQWTRVQRRDRNKAYNKMDIKALAGLTPGFNWEASLAQLGAQTDEVIVRQPSYLTGLSKIFTETPVERWQAYLRGKLLSSAATQLPQAFVDANFEFYGKTISGSEQPRPRWKRGVSLVNGTLGEILGKIYVEKHFKPEARERMEELVGNLKLAFEDRLKQLDWMSETTKEQALAKLAGFRTKIGYTNKWRDYSSLRIVGDDLIGNQFRADRHSFRRNIDRLGKPVDRDEWFMSPQTVNAYYSPTMNEIVFPAAILQPPFFDLNADMAVNYGAIGAAIGHEISHGFDDQGRKSDGDGNLRDWWTEEDAAEFETRAQVMIDQYEAYQPMEGEHVNGKLTLGENIGDLAGLTTAFYAYKRSLNGKPSPVLDGFTGEQRFFMGWARVWRRKYKDEALRNRLLTDPHSPGEYRVIGILGNMPEFYEAFEVKPSDKMYRAPEVRVNIW